MQPWLADHRGGAQARAAVELLPWVPATRTSYLWRESLERTAYKQNASRRVGLRARECARVCPEGLQRSVRKTLLPHLATCFSVRAGLAVLFHSSRYYSESDCVIG